MRKNDQILMWEAYIGESSEAVSMGGPLKVGGSKSPSKSSEDAEDVDGDPYDDEEEEDDELHGILKKCHSGDITPQEAHKHITKMMKGKGRAEEGEENIKRPIRDMNDSKTRKEMGIRPQGKPTLNKDRRPEMIKQGKDSTAKFRKESGLSGKFPTTMPRGV